MTRRKQRIFVFNELYFYGFYEKDDFAKQCELFLSQESDDEAVREALKERAGLVAQQIPVIDEMINSAAIGWTTERMSRVDLSILRLAVFEAFFDDDIPESVAINEAIELAKLFSGEDAASFINGVLGNLSKKNKAEEKNGKDSIPCQPG